MPGPQSEMSPGMVAPTQELIEAVVNAHSLAMRIDEEDALKLLVLLGMPQDEADELLADARMCAFEDSE